MTATKSRRLATMTMAGLGALLTTMTMVSPALAAQPPAAGFDSATTDADRATAMKAPATFQDEFIAQISPLAQHIRDDFDIPASTTIGQAALESNWGRSKFSLTDNNYFGVKCTSATNPGPIATGCSYQSTSENCSDNCGGSMAYFRVYATLEDSLRDYGRLLTTATPYRDALPFRHDPDSFIRKVAPHYATDAQYANKVITIMTGHNLYQYDSGTAPGPQHGEEGIAASASYRFDEQQHVFSRGEDGSLKHSYSTEDGTSESEVYEASLAGDPVAFVSDDTQHVFGRLTDGTIGHWYWYPTDNQPNFEVWGHDIAGNLTGYAFGGQQHIYARGTDGKLKHVYWTEDNGVEQEDLPQDIAGDPVAYVWGDQQHVFGRTPSGELGHWFWTPTDNEPQYTTWGGQLAGNPAGYAIGEQQHVFARGTDGKLKHFYWTQESGVVQEELNQDLQGDPIAYVWDDQQHVFARTTDNQLGHWYWTPTDNEPVYTSWGGSLAGNPTGFATGDHQNVYGRNADGVLQHWYWTPELDTPGISSWTD